MDQDAIIGPRRQKAAQAPPSLLSLPSEVLLRILAPVPLEDRLSSVALACKQLQTLCLAPARIRFLDVQISGEQTVARTEALLRFLVRHGAHVQTLMLDISVPALEEGTSAEAEEVASLVCACLAACATVAAAQPGSGLRALCIEAHTPLHSTSCLPLLTALEELNVLGRGSTLELRLGSSWRQLTAPQGANLSGRLVCEGSGPALPPSLDFLCIEGDWRGDAEAEAEAEVAEQSLHLDSRVLAGLPVLCFLGLFDVAYEPASLAAVSGLSALTQLRMTRVKHLPPAEALVALAGQLRALTAHVPGSETNVGTLEAAVPQLTALQFLALQFEVVEGDAPRLAPAVAHLPRLSALALSFASAEPGAVHQGLWYGPVPALPFATLRGLALPLEAALLVEIALPDAEQLETLCLLMPGPYGQLDSWLDGDDWSALWQFVATHPPLRRLLYDVPADSTPFAYQLLDALLLLKEQRPALESRRRTADRAAIMPPRRQRAAQAPPSLLSLPPEVLPQILASVPLGDRLCRVALACKQLWVLCTAPALLSELVARIQGHSAVAHTQALLLFLVRHGGHVCSLNLDISLTEGGNEDENEMEYDETAGLVSACLGACAARQADASSGLRRLSIGAGTPLVGTSCLPLLTELEELSLPRGDSSLSLRLGGAWRQLTSLRSAQLSGRLCCAGSGPALPPSLTRLCIEGDWRDEESELQELDGRVLEGLPELRCFELHDSVYSSDSLAAISSLTALTRLALSDVAECPPAQALAAVAPSLHALEVRGTCGDEGQLDEAIRVLTALESLALDFAFDERVTPPLPSAVLGLLPRLQRLSLSYFNASGKPAALCAAPWPSVAFPRLRWLALPLAVALASSSFLALARSLETLCLLLPPAMDLGRMDLGRWWAFWRFVATHPPLHCLLYEVPADSSVCSLQLLDALLLLQLQRPTLEVRRLTAPDNRIDLPPTCWAEMRAA